LQKFDQSSVGEKRVQFVSFVYFADGFAPSARTSSWLTWQQGTLASDRRWTGTLQKKKNTSWCEREYV